MTDISATTKRFGAAYERNKKAKTWLEKQQANLFRALDVDLATKVHGQRSVKIPEGEDAEAYIKQYHPGWQQVAWVAGTPNVILEENPSLLSHTYINHENGMVYGRAQVQGSPSLDDDRLRAENPELWERITEWPEPWWTLVHSTLKDMTNLWSRETLDAVTANRLKQAGIQKVLKDLKTFETRDLALIEPYIIPGPVSVRLIPPRKAKPEELGDER